MDASSNLFPIRWAYHVTNVRVSEAEPPPNWEYLERTIPRHCRYDGPLIGLPCVFFTTSLSNGDLPTLSPYPSDGEKGRFYWRLKIPISTFDKYEHFWFCEGVTHPQIRLILTEDDRETLQKHPNIKKINFNDNQYLVRKAGKWFSNDWNKSNYYSNFVLLHRFRIPEGREWDIVCRSGPISQEEYYDVLQRNWESNVLLNFNNTILNNRKHDE